MVAVVVGWFLENCCNVVGVFYLYAVMCPMYNKFLSVFFVFRSVTSVLRDGRSTHFQLA